MLPVAWGYFSDNEVVPSYMQGITFQGTHWMPETAGSTEPIYYVFSHILRGDAGQRDDLHPR